MSDLCTFRAIKKLTGVRHRREQTVAVPGEIAPFGWGQELSRSVSYSRPIFMRFRHFDFETAIWDCRSIALMQSMRLQADVASNERILRLFLSGHGLTTIHRDEREVFRSHFLHSILKTSTRFLPWDVACEVSFATLSPAHG